MPLKDVPPFTPDEEAEHRAAQQKLYSSKASASCGWVAKYADSHLKMVAEHIADLRKAVRSLEAKVAMLEEAQIFYAGTFDKSAQYNRGALVTHRGGLWHCEKPTRGVPGAPNSGFKLMHKTPVARGAK